MKTLREKLEKGNEICGVMIQDFLNPIIIPILDECGYDFIVLDQEHGPSSYRDVQDMVLVAKHLEIAIIVRAAKNSYEYMAKVLDMGADGLMIPHVDTVEQVERVVQCAKYPPAGLRSYGMRQFLSKYGPSSSAAEYIRVANLNMIIFIQVESPESSHNLDEILSGARAADHVDGVIVGPADYTMNMGKIGQFTDKEFESAMERVEASCREHGIHFGIHFGKLDLVRHWRSKGMNILMYSNVKGLIIDRAREILGILKDSGTVKEKSNLY
ncbi:MAG: HpcH/HpaI aldolase family protein [Promethearchaeota archaeon]